MADDGGGSRKWLTLVAMTGALSMILIDATVVSVALPTIQRDLDMSQTSLQWVVNSYLLVLAALVAVGGRLADDLGRVRVFVIGIIVFVAASAAAGASELASSAELLIAARAVQGVGGALMIPASQAIVTSAFPVAERGRAMGIYAGISLGFLALGPLIGGLLTEHAGWEWVFYVNLPIGIATLILTAVARPEGAPIPRKGGFDWIGSGLLVAGLGLTVFALMQSSAWGWGDPAVIGLLGAGLILLVAFVVFELRTTYPLVELRLFGSGNFAADSYVLFMIQFALMGASVFGAIYAQDILSFSPVEAGLALLPMTLVLLALAAPSGSLYDHIGPRLPVTLGALLAAAGFFWQGSVLLRFDYWWLVPGYIATGAGVALIMTPANTDGMNAAPADLRGQASGVLQTVRQVGGTVGIAVLTSIVVNVNRSTLDTKLADEGITGTTATKIEGILAEAQGGDVSRLADIPADDMAQALEASAEAYSTGLQVAWVVTGVLLLVSAIVAGWKLRKVEYEDDVATHPLADHAHPRESVMA